jgi:COMPASS component SWD3
MIAADKLIKLWDSRTGEFRQNLEGHTKGISDIAWSSSSDLLASGSDDKTVRLWDVNTVGPFHIRTDVRLNVLRY